MMSDITRAHLACLPPSPPSPPCRSLSAPPSPLAISLAGWPAVGRGMAAGVRGEDAATEAFEAAVR